MLQLGSGMRLFSLVVLAVAALMVSSVRVAQPEDATRAALAAIGRAVGSGGQTRPRTPQPHGTGGFQQMAFTFPPATAMPALSDEPAAAVQLRRVIQERRLVLTASYDRGGTASTAYTATLVADGRAIDRANVTSDIGARLKLLNAVNDDLQAKEESVRGSSAAGGNPFADVTVIVDTVAGTVPRPGYQVLFNPQVEFDATTARFPFPSPSSPTRYALAPGRYVAWAQKGNTKTVPQDVRVVRNGGVPQRVQITVP